MCARRRRRRSEGRSVEPRRPLLDAYPMIDLHGETADSAVRLAEAWLRQRQVERALTVRIVTGRGLHSAGPPVLPGAISDLLRGLGGVVVAGWEREPGGGSFLVELLRGPGRKPGTQYAAVAETPPRRDAALRRRAEESLAELGITPTPELIAAEMRRLKADG